MQRFRERDGGERRRRRLRPSRTSRQTAASVSCWLLAWSVVLVASADLDTREDDVSTSSTTSSRASSLGPGEDNIAAASAREDRRLQCANKPKALPSTPRCTFCTWPTKLDPCIYDVSSCEVVPAGASCTLFCRDPYVGNSSVAFCLSSNSVVGAEVMYSPLLCRYNTCADPPAYAAPRGYVKSDRSQSFICATGYGGVVQKSCSLGAACKILDATLSGCLPVQPCASASNLAALGSCDLDFGDCGTVQPGASCVVRCKAPFVGNSVVAECPSDNTVLGGPLRFRRPNCTLVCPDYQDNAPAGYVCPRGNCLCAEDYIGKPLLSCNVTATCEVHLGLSGCSAIVPCVSLQPESFDKCQFDVSTCTPKVYGGLTCEISCTPPYQGISSVATCIRNNIDPNMSLVFKLPSCVPICGESTTLAPGYTRNFPGAKVTCDRGYGGRVARTCYVVDDCTTLLVYSGCVPVVPCKLLTSVDACYYDWSRCRAGVSPLTPCEVGCASPGYAGTSGLAMCSDGNVDPNLMMFWGTAPNCTPAKCDLIPEGYMKLKTGWHCSPGYIGAARPIFEDCDRKPLLDGCVRLRSCRSLDINASGKSYLPEEATRCAFNHSCVNVFTGNSCQIDCMPPYFGKSTQAMCPNNNIDPSTRIEFKLPNCELRCDDPYPIPRGYVKGRDSWACSHDFFGNVTPTCYLLDNCKNYLNLTGCQPRSPCALNAILAEIYQTSLQDRVNLSDCSNVPQGEACYIGCAPPYQGEFTRAECPYEVHKGFQELQVALPLCRLPCDTVPVGYKKTLYGWACMSGYGGTPVQICNKTERCDADFQLSGCFPVQSCRLPAGIDTCMYDITECPDRVLPGGSCLVRCRPPYQGQVVVATCSLDNVDPMNVIDWNQQKCSFQDCPEPVEVPPAYTKASGAWKCNPVGFIGTAQTICKTLPAPSCAVAPATLVGCGKSAPCAPLRVDACRFDAQSCSHLSPGQSCDVFCRSPYLGNVTTALCPLLNIDTLAPPLWTPSPHCLLNCPDPQTDPIGYTRVESHPSGWMPDDLVSGWVCSNGFSGTAKASCVIDSSCRTSLIFTGCVRLATCAAPQVSACGVDASDCARVLPGFTCQLTCLDGYSLQQSGPTIAACPPGNIIPNGPLDGFAMPSCRFEFCADQKVAGYIGYAGFFSCAQGYAGEASWNCSAPSDGTCTPRLVLWGCYETQPCRTPQLDACVYDISQCGNKLLPNSSCSVACKAPYVGKPVGTFQCSATNPDPMTMVTYSLPNCTPACAVPATPPFGYNKLLGKTSLGDMFSCASTHTGTPFVACLVNVGCVAELVFQGCDRLQPCLSMNRSCQVNVTGCTNVFGGRSCFVPCLEPYRGIGGRFACPINNTDRYQELQVVTAQNCTLVCTDPGKTPIGYTKYTGSLISDAAPFDFKWNETRSDQASERWSCVDNVTGANNTTTRYTGNLSASCSIINAARCTATLSLGGCAPAKPCRPLLLDRCQYRFDGCDNLEPKATCVVRCAAAYISSSLAGRGSCPYDSIGDRPPNVQLPDCYLKCKEPPSVVGYTHEILPNFTANDTNGTGAWICAQGYIGKARTSCYTNATTCEPIWTISGCMPKVPCKAVDPRTADECRYNFTDCKAVKNRMPGETCSIGCMDPYLGDYETEGFCPADNTDPNQEIMIRAPGLPECRLLCPEPAIRLPGYFREPTRWRCDEPAYIGQALVQCQPNNVIDDVTKVTTCGVDSVFTGCVPTVPCKAPYVAPICDISSDDCAGTPANRTCEIRCVYPFFGLPAVAYCPEGNLDPNTVVIWTKPTCVVACPDPSYFFRPIPAGYNKTEETDEAPAWSRRRSWACADGYVGVPVEHCTAVQDPYRIECGFSWSLEGCARRAPCAPPVFDVPGCYDAKDCGNVLPGQSCHVGCHSPCADPSDPFGLNPFYVLTCPQGNSDPTTQLVGTMPQCLFSCDPVPDGYERRAGRWYCSEGYIGEVTKDQLGNRISAAMFAKEECVVGEICPMDLKLTGCARLVPCQVPLWVDGCKYDVRACRNLPSGAQCNITCKAPYVGNGTTSGRCPNLNTDQFGLILNEDTPLPDCSYSLCSDPIFPPTGYTWNGHAWVCAVGFTGTATRYCGTVSFIDCTPVARLIGCTRTQPCATPQALPVDPPILRVYPPITKGIAWNYEDPCMVDFSSCNGMYPGQTCSIGCLFPYVTLAASIGLCRADNTDASSSPVFHTPSCQLTCEESGVWPGYVKNGSDYMCDIDYGGRAIQKCTIDIYCQSTFVLTGCAPLQPCLPPGDLASMPEVTECPYGFVITEKNGSCAKVPSRGFRSCADEKAAGNCIRSNAWMAEHCLVTCGWQNCTSYVTKLLYLGYNGTYFGPMMTGKSLTQCAKACTDNTRCRAIIYGTIKREQTDAGRSDGTLDGKCMMVNSLLPGKLDARWKMFSVRSGCDARVEASTNCDHDFQLLHSAWIPSYENNIPKSIKAAGQFVTVDYSPLQDIRYQQLYLECASTTSQIRRLFTLTAPTTFARASGVAASIVVYSDDSAPTYTTTFATNFSGRAVWNADALGLRGFLLALSEVHCSKNLANQKDNPDLGQYARVWVRMQTSPVSQDDLPTCLPVNATWILRGGCDSSNGVLCNYGEYCAGATTTLAIKQPSSWNECATFCNADVLCDAFSFRSDKSACYTCQSRISQGSAPNWGFYTKPAAALKSPLTQASTTSGRNIEVVPMTKLANGDAVFTDRSIRFRDVGDYGISCVFIRGPDDDMNCSGEATQWTLLVNAPVTVYIDFWRGPAHASMGFSSWRQGWAESGMPPTSTTVGVNGTGVVYERQFDPGFILLGGNGGRGQDTYFAFVCAREPYLVRTPCTYDISQCSKALVPGDSCNMSCQSPQFVGSTTIASCPAGNTNPLRLLSYTLPRCMFAACPPSLVPQGYSADAAQPYVYTCDAGWVGDPRRTCEFSSEPTAPPTPWPTIAAPPMGNLRASTKSGRPIRVIDYLPFVGDSTHTDDDDKFISLGDFASMSVYYVQTPSGDRYNNASMGVTLLASISLSVYLDFQGGQVHATHVLAPSRGWTKTMLKGTIGSKAMTSGVVYAKVFPPGTTELMGNNDCSNYEDGNDSNYDTNNTSVVKCSFGMYKMFVVAAGNETSDSSPPPWNVLAGCASQYAYKFTGCGKRIPCQMPDERSLDACRYDYSQCTQVYNGYTCPVQCRQPYVRVGASGNATCFLNNTDAYGGFLFTLPRCDLLCPDNPPSFPQPEYLRAVPPSSTESGWVCAPGYTGVVKRNCEIRSSYATGVRSCTTITTLTGCTQLRNCTSPPASCSYNVSSCQRVAPNSSCAIPCRAGFTLQGTPASGRCPANNTDASYVVEFMPPNCTFDNVCSDPNVRPSGYFKLGDSWQCLPPAYGVAKERCVIADDCKLYKLLSGCSLMDPCFAPSDPGCGVNMTQCQFVAGGQTCEVSCLAGFTVDTTIASCSTAGSGILTWSRPNCNFISCSAPSTTPGYIYRASAWVCADGFTGAASVTCNRCNGVLQLSGCLPLAPCVVPLDFASDGGCPTLNFAGCQTKLGPGHSCSVGCLAPFEGNPTVASCPIDNVDPARLIIFTAPLCLVGCTLPLVLPLGVEGAGQNGAVVYENGRPMLRCAKGYTGEVNLRCGLNSNCNETEMKFGGCAMLAPCANPSASLGLRSCHYLGGEECETLAAGATCQVSCAGPRVGQTQRGTCPSNNVDPSTALSWTGTGGMTCTWQHCPDNIPTGYMKTFRGWECAPGHIGRAIQGCGSECCDPTLMLTGCDELYPCKVPSVDLCKYDFALCTVLDPGGDCYVKCGAPYTGIPTRLFCPVDHIDPAGVLHGDLPVCSLICPDLLASEVPEGYIPEGNSRYRCQPGYLGVANAACQVDSSCVSRMVLSGCVKIKPCTLPAVNDICLFDVSNCSNTISGKSCYIRCRYPYDGTPTIASCPADGSADLSLSWPVCRLSCTDPEPAPAGYNRSVGEGLSAWACSKTHAGVVKRECKIDSQCHSTTVLSGCLLKRPCSALVVEDVCAYDPSACNAVAAGDRCEISCRTPYGGAPTAAACPANNTDPTNVLSFTLPRCTCRDPLVVPSAYRKTAAQGWICTVGYIGKATVVCGSLGAGCMSESVLQGCEAAVPCNVTLLPDIDDREGHYSGGVNFGPAEVGGAVDESTVSAYRILLADSCGEPLIGVQALAEVPRYKLPIRSRCCEPGLYNAAVTIDLSQNPLAASVYVVALLASGEQAPKGMSVDIVDGFPPGSPQTPRTGAALRLATPTLAMVFALAIVFAVPVQTRTHSRLLKASHRGDDDHCMH